MANEIELTQNDFTVTFQPSQISINNFDELKAKINDYAKKYDGLVATDESLKGAKSARAELNKLIKTINDKRIAVKRDYDEPYNDFKRDVDELQVALKSTIEPIDTSIKTIENKQRDERTLKVRELINRMAPEYGLDPKDISIEDKWTNKISNMQLTKLLKEGFTAKKHIQDAFNANKKLVEEHCKLVGTDPAGWISQMNEDTDASQIISSIDKSIDDEKKRREYDEAIKKMAQTHVNDKTIDKETGEIIEEDDDQPIDDNEPDKSDSYSMTFEVTGELPVLKELYKFIDSKNLKFSVVKNPSKVSD